MKIVLLAPPNVEGYYTASLLVRGFKAVTIPAVAPVLDFPKLMQEYLPYVTACRRDISNRYFSRSCTTATSKASADRTEATSLCAIRKA